MNNHNQVMPGGCIHGVANWETMFKHSYLRTCPQPLSVKGESKSRSNAVIRMDSSVDIYNQREELFKIGRVSSENSLDGTLHPLTHSQYGVKEDINYPYGLYLETRSETGEEVSRENACGCGNHADTFYPKSEHKMMIHVSETGRCWICGDDVQEVTSHHVLPRHLNPVNNIVIPICVNCHKRINIEDINGMYTYLFKIKKMIGENVGGVNKVIKDLDALVEIKKHTPVNAKEKVE